MNVKDKIVEIIETLDAIDEYDNGLADKLSNADSKLSDLYHVVEKNKLKTNECYRMIQELRKVLLERRKVKDDMALLNVYKSQRERLPGDKTRAFLKQSIYKESNKLNSPYKNRVYTEEEINEILEGAKNDL